MKLKDNEKTISRNFLNIYHANRKKISHPDLHREIYSQTAVCYMRFLRKVRITKLRLPVLQTGPHPAGCGRWVPNVPTHPAHVKVSVLDKKENRWFIFKDVNIPPCPAFQGEELSQDMTTDEMNDYLNKAVEEHKDTFINLDNLETDCIKVECDLEHTVWSNHGECNGGPYNVPFNTLKPLEALGYEIEDDTYPDYVKKLEKTRFSPCAPEGMEIDTENPLELIYKGKKLCVGFSLIRPLMTHLSWDYFGEGEVSTNRLLFKSVDSKLGGLNGPSYILPEGNFCAQNMGGNVSVEGNKIHYYDIETGCGIKLSALFTVTKDSIKLELEQEAAETVLALEGETWRLLWDMKNGMTSVAGIPEEKEGRNGFIQLPALITADNRGCLTVELKEGAGAFHTESYRESMVRSTSFVTAEKDTGDTPFIIPKGNKRAVFELKPSILLPVPSEKEHTLTEGLKRSWAAGFTAYRPEFGGFSNNAISTNCHVNQYVPIDFSSFTAPAECGLNPLDMVKFSISRALLDGGGYGYHRDLYLDSDPILISGAGRIFQLSRGEEWLEHVAPGIKNAAVRIMDSYDIGEKMIVCKSLSGNSGTYRWSSNAMDVVGFGHIDAYVNAWAFRGLKNAAALLKILGESTVSEKCLSTAESISENYARHLINPETGWVAGWKSRDGKLHDYAFVWINGVACAFGVMDYKDSQQAMRNFYEPLCQLSFVKIYVFSLFTPFFERKTPVLL